MIVFTAGYADDYLQDLDEKALQDAFKTKTSTECRSNSCIVELLDEATAVVHFPSYCESFDTVQKLAVSKWHCPPVFGLEKVGKGWRVRYLKTKSGVMPASEVPNYIKRTMAQRREHKAYTRAAFLCFLAFVFIVGSLFHVLHWCVPPASAQTTIEAHNK